MMKINFIPAKTLKASKHAKEKSENSFVDRMQFLSLLKIFKSNFKSFGNQFWKYYT